jgi:hypothetical protein
VLWFCFPLLCFCPTPSPGSTHPEGQAGQRLRRWGGEGAGGGGSPPDFSPPWPAEKCGAPGGGGKLRGSLLRPRLGLGSRSVGGRACVEQRFCTRAGREGQGRDVSSGPFVRRASLRSGGTRTSPRGLALRLDPLTASHSHERNFTSLFFACTSRVQNHKQGSGVRCCGGLGNTIACKHRSLTPLLPFALGQAPDRRGRAQGEPGSPPVGSRGGLGTEEPP